MVERRAGKNGDETDKTKLVNLLEPKQRPATGKFEATGNFSGAPLQCNVDRLCSFSGLGLEFIVVFMLYILHPVEHLLLHSNRLCFPLLPVLVGSPGHVEVIIGPDQAYWL